MPAIEEPSKEEPNEVLKAIQKKQVIDSQSIIGLGHDVRKLNVQNREMRTSLEQLQAEYQRKFEELSKAYLAINTVVKKQVKNEIRAHQREASKEQVSLQKRIL